LPRGTLDLELAFQAENDVEEVDRLATEIGDEGRGGLHFIEIASERVSDDVGDLRAGSRRFLPW